MLSSVQKQWSCMLIGPPHAPCKPISLIRQSRAGRADNFLDTLHFSWWTMRCVLFVKYAYSRVTKICWSFPRWIYERGRVSLETQVSFCPLTGASKMRFYRIYLGLKSRYRRVSCSNAFYVRKLDKSCFKFRSPSVGYQASRSSNFFSFVIFKCQFAQRLFQNGLLRQLYFVYKAAFKIRHLIQKIYINAYWSNTLPNHSYNINWRQTFAPRKGFCVNRNQLR